MADRRDLQRLFGRSADRHGGAQFLQPVHGYNADAARRLFAECGPRRGRAGWRSFFRITTAQGLQARSTLRAIADAAGNPLLVNPTPGVLGSLAPAYIEGPGSFRLDLNVLKRVKIRENVDFQFTANFIDALNTPQWDNPIVANRDINSLNFGRITGAGGNRIIVLEGRINF
jgi:hypothetical protein